MADDTLLLAVLESLRERGALGEPSLVGAVAHAESFVAAIPADCLHLLDLGSGGGLPGLVIAARLPHIHVTLVDRRERRMDLLRRACARMEFGDRVIVRTGDVRQLAQLGELSGSFDAVTARSFGPPLWTLRCAHPFLRRGGSAIVSEPPPADETGTIPAGLVQVELRWPPEAVRGLGFHNSEPFLAVRRFVRL